MIRQVSYLGPEGSYSEEAAIEMYGAGVELVPYGTKPKVLEAAEGGDVCAAVLPLVNSTEGAVSETDKLLLATDLQIVREEILPVRHCLLSADQIEQTEISKVYAHSQAIGQCVGWLENHVPDADVIPVSSNSAAAEMAKDKQGVAAIASTRAADIYDLKVVEEGINDADDNQTRFISLSDIDTEPTGKDKTSLVFRTKRNDPGSLVRIISPLAYRGINMSRIHSQPIGLEKYIFYVDLEGHRHEADVQEALHEMEQQARDFKILGSYPLATITKAA